MINRLVLPDIIRAFSVLYIVAFWHIFDYIDTVSWKYDVEFMTLGVLAVFTFLSGLFLGKKEMTFRSFYMSRLKRFFPLLALSLLCFYILGLTGFRTMFLALTGLSCFILPQPLTLWYFSMMIVFYALTPVLLYKLNLSETNTDRIKFLLRSLIVYAFMLILYFLFEIDIRIVIYYPFYIVGILCPFSVVSDVRKYKTKLFIVSCFSLCLWFVLGGSFSDIFLANSIMIFIIILCSYIENIKSPQLYKVINYISYSSMSLYLFHRVVFKIINMAFGVGVYMEYWQIAIMISVTFVVAYFIQKGYDYLIAKIL